MTRHVNVNLLHSAGLISSELSAYSRDDGTYRYIKQLMALPFLPTQEIDPAFQWLRLQATTDALKELVQYISETWISSTVYPPKTEAYMVRPSGPIMTSKDGIMAWTIFSKEQYPFLPPDTVAEKRSWAVCRASKVSVRQEVATHPKEEIQETPGPSLRVVGTICKQSDNCYPAP